MTFSHSGAFTSRLLLELEPPLLELDALGVVVVVTRVVVVTTVH